MTESDDWQDGYDVGFDEGVEEGRDEGYSDGYEDGSYEPRESVITNLEEEITDKIKQQLYEEIFNDFLVALKNGDLDIQSNVDHYVDGIQMPTTLYLTYYGFSDKTKTITVTNDWICQTPQEFFRAIKDCV